jgi:hypothetical protein
MLGNVIDLKKKSGIILEKLGLAGVQANIVWAIDESYSMDHLIRNGTVQEQADRFIGVGMNMSPTKSIDVYGFDDGHRYVGTANEGNHKDFVKKAGIAPRGGTSYAPVMKQIIAKYGTPIEAQVVQEQVQKEVEPGFLGKLFGAKSKTVTETVTRTAQVEEVKAVKVPTLVFFMTDGANSDTRETERVIREAAKQGIFWQFVGIGGSSFPFLEKLDDLTGRFLDNADFTAIKDVMGVSDEKLFEAVLKEFPGWLRQAKQKGLIL